MPPLTRIRTAAPFSVLAERSFVTFANAASVGANTVKRPGPDSVFARPACFTSETSVLNCPAAAAFCTTFSWAARGVLVAASAPAARTATAVASSAAVVSRSLVMPFLLSVECLLDGARRRLAAPATGDREQPRRPVDSSDADEPVDDPAGGVRLAEIAAEDRCHQVELGDRDEAPVEPADDQQGCREQIDPFHPVPPLSRFRPDSSGTASALSNLCPDSVQWGHGRRWTSANRRTEQAHRHERRLVASMGAALRAAEP